MLMTSLRIFYFVKNPFTANLLVAGKRNKRIRKKVINKISALQIFDKKLQKMIPPAKNITVALCQLSNI